MFAVSCIALMALTSINPSLITSDDGDQFGIQLFSVGDVTGDGIAEIVVTDPEFSSKALPEMGAVWLVNVVDGAAVYTHCGDEAKDRFGLGAALGPDLDGDKVPDYVVWGAKSSKDGRSKWMIVSARQGIPIKRSRTEVDSSDMTMCVLPSLSTQPDDGAVVLVGRTTISKIPEQLELLDVASLVSLKTLNWAGRGSVMAQSDIMLGDGSSRSGWSVLLIGHKTPVHPFTFLRKQSEWCFSNAQVVASDGTRTEWAEALTDCRSAMPCFRVIGGLDVNGDDTRDWICVDAGASPEHSRVVARSGLTGDVIWGTAKGSAGFRARSLCWISDVNSDQFADILVGSPGAVDMDQALRIISGKDGAVLRVIPCLDLSEYAVTYFGSSICAVGDVDKDGSEDFAVASLSPDGWRFNEGVVRIISGKTGSVLRRITRKLVDAASKY